MYKRQKSDCAVHSSTVNINISYFASQIFGHCAFTTRGKAIDCYGDFFHFICNCTITVSYTHLDELKAKGQKASFDEILENVKQRDYIDQHREVSPLRKADDALLLDNTELTIQQQKEWLFNQ